MNSYHLQLASANKMAPDHLNPSKLTKFTALWASSGIIICYILAVSLGQEEPFPHCSISGTAGHYPEYIVFRITEITSAWLLCFVWFMQYWWLKELCNTMNTTLCLTWIIPVLGFVGDFFFTISTATIDTGKRNSHLHLLGAGTFFGMTFAALILQFIYVTILRSKNTCQFMSPFSYGLKCVLAVLGTIMIYMNTFDKQFPIPNLHNIIEYFGTALVIIYIYSFSWDWKNYQLDFSLNQGFQMVNQNQSQPIIAQPICHHQMNVQMGNLSCNQNHNM